MKLALTLTMTLVRITFTMRTWPSILSQFDTTATNFARLHRKLDARSERSLRTNNRTLAPQTLAFNELRFDFKRFMKAGPDENHDRFRTDFVPELKERRRILLHQKFVDPCLYVTDYLEDLEQVEYEVFNIQSQLDNFTLPLNRTTAGEGRSFESFGADWDRLLDEVSELKTDLQTIESRVTGKHSVWNELLRHVARLYFELDADTLEPKAVHDVINELNSVFAKTNQVQEILSRRFHHAHRSVIDDDDEEEDVEDDDDDDDF